MDSVVDISYILLACFAIAALAQLFYYLFVYLRVVLPQKSAKTPHTDELFPVSVIVCARNEADSLVQNLPALLEQDYPDFEVIIVNNCSDDNTEHVLAELKQKYPRLRNTIIKKDGSFRNSKKFAASVGIRAARHEWLLFTDAACRPESALWIASVSKHFAASKDIVLGYGGYMVQKGFLNKWIRYDTCFAALQYFGFAKMGKAYKGIGRNLAYRKSLFFAHNGFAEQAHILSGDDDLFVNQAATGKNIATTYEKDAHTRSFPHKTLREWISQTRKNIVTGKYYKFGQFFRLALEPFSRVAMWASFCALMFLTPFWEYVLAAFALRMILFLSVIGAAAKRLNEPGIVKHAVLFDLAMPFVYLYVYLLNSVSSKQNQWK